MSRLKQLFTRRMMVRIGLGVVGLALGIVGVLAMREATLSTHGERVGERIELVVHAKTHAGESGQTLDEMVKAQILSCRLEVTSDVVDDEIEPLPDDEFRAVLEPSMDETNRRQFRGCLEDWAIDGLQMSVVSLEEL